MAQDGPPEAVFAQALLSQHTKHKTRIHTHNGCQPDVVGAHKKVILPTAPCYDREYLVYWHRQEHGHPRTEDGTRLINTGLGWPQAIN